MKRLFAVIFFSVAVIMCEQQTLFAPHYTDFGGMRYRDSAGVVRPKSKVAAVEMNSGRANADFSEKNQSKPWFSTDGLMALITGVASDMGLTDPTDCPNMGGQEGAPIVKSTDQSNFRGCIPTDPCMMNADLALDLFFELVDAGFTEEEAIELVEMVLESDLRTARPQPLSGEATGKVTHLTKTKIKVQQEVGPTTPFLDIDAATVVVDRQGNPATVYKGDRVKVEFTGNHADRITVL